jgi:arylsulfatase
MVVHWPEGIRSKGEIRSQFTHVTDVAPTVLEAAGLPFPKSVNGTEQIPFAGTSFVFSFEDADAPETHTTQYFEMFGNRGIYHEGWTASTRHSIPWLMDSELPALENDVWELYT